MRIEGARTRGRKCAPKILCASPLQPLLRRLECGGSFIRKTQRPFSAMSIDQAHEQNNKCVKDDGGAVGFTENSS